MTIQSDDVGAGEGLDERQAIRIELLVYCRWRLHLLERELL